MSMLKLLAVGRSFAGTVDGPSRYKMNTSFLPKFPVPEGGSRLAAERRAAVVEGALFDENLNPVLPAPAVRAVVGGSAVRPSTAEVGAENSGPENVRTCETGNRPGFGEPAHGFAEVRRGGGGAKAGEKRGRGGWLRGLFGGRARVKPEIFVQGELALESIKVVRNDLSEADLELVPAKSGARNGGGGQWERSGAGRGVIWSELSARLFAMRRIGS